MSLNPYYLHTRREGQCFWHTVYGNAVPPCLSRGGVVKKCVHERRSGWPRRRHLCTACSDLRLAPARTRACAPRQSMDERVAEGQDPEWDIADT